MKHRLFHGVLRSPAEAASVRSLDVPILFMETDTQPLARESVDWPSALRERWAETRSICVRLTQQRWFERVILLAIGLNSLLMAVSLNPMHARTRATGLIDWPREQTPAFDLNFISYGTAQQLDYAFIILFSLEAATKMVAFGLFHGDQAYLRSGWNWLDLLVVVSGWIQLNSAAPEGLMVLRVVRVLRPLRSMTRVTRMRVLVECILSALPQCTSAMLILLTLVLFFGIVGVQLFYGKLRHQCYRFVDDPAVEGVVGTSSGWVGTGDTCEPLCERDPYTQALVGTCGSLGSGTRQQGVEWWGYSCQAGERCLCRNSGTADATCTLDDNPSSGVNNFDNLYWGAITFLQTT